MKNIAQQLAELFERENRRKGRWRKVVTALAAVVVFVTTYALILPGITLEKDPVCGMEEHTHTADCYTQLTSVTKTALVCNAETLQIHQHTPDCYNEDGELVCGYADFVVHTHDENCYDENGSLVCTLPEIELHTHDESCYDADGNLICGKPEVTLHTHDSSCFDENGNLICKKLQVLEHHHSDTCFAEVEQPLDTTALTCTNTDPDHEHTALCYGTWVLTCNKPEHTHTDACYAAQDEDAADEGTEEIPADEETEETLAAKPGIMLFAESGDAESNDAANGTGDTVAQDDNRTYLDKYIKGTTFTSAKYNSVTDAVEVGFKMTFAMDKKAIQGANYQYTYTLPEGIIIPEDLLNVEKEGYDTDGATGFTYEFVKGDKGYHILIDFDENYVNGAKDNFNCYINFNASAGKEAWKESEGYEFKFNDNCTVTIPADKIDHPENATVNYNIAVSKSASGYDYNNNKITYTVKVDSTKGTPDPLNLTDVLTLNGLNVKDVQLVGSVKRDAIDEWGNVQWKETQDVVTPTVFKYNDSTGEINMTLGALQPEELDGKTYGQRYTITYDVYLEEPLAGSQYTVGNKATVSGTDSKNNETVTDYGETSTTINKDLIVNKSGNYDKSNDKIQWTITVNENKNDIAETTLTDIMFPANVTISPETGYMKNGNTITFVGGMDGKNKQSYTITYKTDAPQVGSDGTVTVTNTVAVDPPGDNTPSKDVTASVKIDKTMKMVKTGSYDKATNLITWTITVNENGNNIAGAELTDGMFKDLDPSAFTVTVGGQKVTPGDDNSGIQIVQTNNNKVDKITFSGVNGDTNTNTYTITYTTTPDIELDKTGTVTNSAIFDPTPGTAGGEITQEPGVFVDRTISFTKTGSYDSASKTIKWRIAINSSDPKSNIANWVLKDQFLANATGLTVSKNGDGNTDAAKGNYTINRDADGKISSIKFLPIGETEMNTDCYLIEYTTPAAAGWEESTVHNKATLTPPGGEEVPREVDVYVPAEGNVVKKNKGATTPDSEGKIAITWRTEVTVPSGGLPAGTVITDTLGDDGQWMDWQQIQKWGTVLFAKQTSDSYIPDLNYWWPQGETYDIYFYTSDGNKYTYADIVSNNGVQGKRFVKYEIHFPNGIPADPYGGQKIFFEYDSYADVSQVTDTATYKNNVTVTPPNLTPKSSEATYTYKKGGVWKTDGSGKADPSSISTSDGKLTWKVKVRTDTECDTVTVVDTLPDGVTLTNVQFNYNTWLTPDTNGNISGNHFTKYTIQGTAVKGEDSDKQTVTLSITKYNQSDNQSEKIPAGTEFELVFNCQIDNNTLAGMENKTEATEFLNTVTAKEDETDLGSSSQQQDVTYTKPITTTNPVDKSGSWNNDARRLEYSVVLNPDGTNLNPDSDTLDFTDTMNNYIANPDAYFESALLPGSVELCRAVQDADGTWKTGEKITDWKWKVESKKENGCQVHVITATVPDETPMILKYAYTVWVPEDSLFGKDPNKSTYYGLYNKATLTGKESYSGDKKFNVTWEKSDTSAGISAERSMILYKVDESGYGKRLPGAEFELHSNTEQSLKTYTTDDKGSITIKMPTEEEIKEGAYPFKYNVVYHLVETKAPEGYLLPNPAPKYFFYFSKTGDGGAPLDQDQIPEGAVDLSVNGSVIYCENEKATTSITVDKKWVDKSGNPITDKTGSVAFDLYRIANTTPPSESGGGTGGSGGASVGDSVSCIVNCNYGNKLGAEKMTGFDTVKVGDTVKISVNYTWNAQGLNTKPKDWQGVSKDENVEEGYSNNGTTYDYTCVITDSRISFHTGDQEPSIVSVTCTLVKAAPTPSPTPEPGIVYKDSPYTINPNSATGWKYTIDNLPKQGTVTDGSGTHTVYYTYYIKEQNGERYNASYVNNDGIVSGTITVTNTESDNPGYELPATGGTGTAPLYTMGAALSVSAGLLLVHKKKRRKEGRPSS